MELKKKRLQLAKLFQVLSDGRPMAEFTSWLAFYELLPIFDLLKIY